MKNLNYRALQMFDSEFVISLNSYLHIIVYFKDFQAEKYSETKATEKKTWTISVNTVWPKPRTNPGKFLRRHSNFPCSIIGIVKYVNSAFVYVSFRIEKKLHTFYGCTWRYTATADE